MTARGFIVSAPRSSSGKTTITLGLLAALARRGVKVRAAKSGPDYIDPAFHASATGAKGINLDTWAMPPPLIDELIAGTSRHADALVIEGAMGLFDGVPGTPGRTGAASDLAARFSLPVLLVLDVKLTTHGVLTVGAALSLIFGALLFFNSGGPYQGPQVNPILVYAMGGLVGLIGAYVVSVIVRTRRRPNSTGMESMIGATVIASTPLLPDGRRQSELDRQRGDQCPGQRAPLCA